MDKAREWVERLNDEDLMFIKRFVLVSGSLKALAEDYGVSYPTVRLRLDRMIEKIKVLEDERISSEFEREVFALYAEGELDLSTAKKLIESHRREMEEENDTHRNSN